MFMFTLFYFCCYHANNHAAVTLPHTNAEAFEEAMVTLIPLLKNVSYCCVYGNHKGDFKTNLNVLFLWFKYTFAKKQ